MKRTRIVGVGLALVFVGASALYANHSWGGYHWARTTPQFTLKLGNNLTTQDWTNHLNQSSSDWNSPTKFGGTSTPILTAVTAGTSPDCSMMVAGTTQVCNGSYGQNGWLGLASITLGSGKSRKHITAGTAKMNDTYFNTATYNNTNEREHVMCQEVAHTFGLGHQSTSGASLNTCMDYFSNTGANAGSTASTTPNAHDFEELNTIYAHLDSTTTVAAKTTLPASANEVTNDSNTWGVLVSRNARRSIYERQNADGSRTLTDVYWTLGWLANHGYDPRY